MQIRETPYVVFGSLASPFIAALHIIKYHHVWPPRYYRFSPISCHQSEMKCDGADA